MAGKAKKKPSSRASRGVVQRRFIVMAALVTVLSGTSALLLALSPAPLAPEPLLIAADEQGNDLTLAIFRTQETADNSPWKYIYIHQSKSVAGNVTMLGNPGDHFLVGNGEGLVDGEIQMTQRWNLQQPPAPPAGVGTMNSNVISVCVVGDFDQMRPTAAQFHRIADLTKTLQAKYRIAAENVMLYPEAATQGGIGRHFPVTALREQLLP
jgi:hypothetical protein